MRKFTLDCKNGPFYDVPMAYWNLDVHKELKEELGKRLEVLKENCKRSIKILKTSDLGKLYYKDNNFVVCGLVLELEKKGLEDNIITTNDVSNVNVSFEKLDQLFDTIEDNDDIDFDGTNYFNSTILNFN
jgi:hypothetical protein